MAATQGKVLWCATTGRRRRSFCVSIVARITNVSHDEFDWLGLEFRDLWGRWPTLIDWQNVFFPVEAGTPTGRCARRG
ncbi:hypothetical protein [Nonomuraea sp. NPDC050643]|uniref:hypothetical protein n=1 Tax=Nonomuraea sp. NPDC050643 TaxID=3155660 RepID=UPI0033CC7850